MAWSIEGEYFENCSCDVLCPCLTSAMQVPADAPRCQVPMAVRITSGSFDGVSLDGLCFVLVYDSPAVMAEGNWKQAIYLDERATAEQRAALERILLGDAGGPPAMLAGLVGETLGVKSVPIRFESEGNRRRVEVPGVMEIEVEGVLGGASGKVMEITEAFHPFGDRLPIAKATVGRYADPDYGLAWDNTGKNGHFTAFAWQG